MSMTQQIVGNLYNKYLSQKPLERYLLNRFISQFIVLYNRVNPNSVLDIGCGEGYLTEILQKKNPKTLFVGTDTDANFLLGETSNRVRNLVTFELPRTCFQKESFDLVILSEVLEHIEHTHDALDAVSSLARYGVIITVPHEPFWMICNLLRFHYIGRWGDTPGRVKHFSYKGFRRTLRRHFHDVCLYSCFPWLMALCLKGND